MPLSLRAYSTFCRVLEAEAPPLPRLLEIARSGRWCEARDLAATPLYREHLSPVITGAERGVEALDRGIYSSLSETLSLLRSFGTEAAQRFIDAFTRIYDAENVIRALELLSFRGVVRQGGLVPLGSVYEALKGRELRSVDELRGALLARGLRDVAALLPKGTGAEARMEAALRLELYVLRNLEERVLELKPAPNAPRSLMLWRELRMSLRVFEAYIRGARDVVGRVYGVELPPEPLEAVAKLSRRSLLPEKLVPRLSSAKEPWERELIEVELVVGEVIPPLLYSGGSYDQLVRVLLYRFYESRLMRLCLHNCIGEALHERAA